MSEHNKAFPNSSGKCMYCNNFYRRLSTHMLLSEACILASQQSLLPKKRHFDEEDRNTSSKEDSSFSVHISNASKRPPHKLNKEYVGNKNSQKN